MSIFLTIYYAHLTSVRFEHSVCHESLLTNLYIFIYMYMLEQIYTYTYLMAQICCNFDSATFEIVEIINSSDYKSRV